MALNPAQGAAPARRDRERHRQQRHDDGDEGEGHLTLQLHRGRHGVESAGLQLLDVVAQLPVRHLQRVGRLGLEIAGRLQPHLALGERLVADGCLHRSGRSPRRDRANPAGAGQPRRLACARGAAGVHQIDAVCVRHRAQPPRRLVEVIAREAREVIGACVEVVVVVDVADFAGHPAVQLAERLSGEAADDAVQPVRPPGSHGRARTPAWRTGRRWRQRRTGAAAPPCGTG